MFGLGTNSTTEWIRGKLGVTDEKVLQGIDNGLINYTLSDEEGDSIIDVSNSLDPRGGLPDLYRQVTSDETPLLKFLGGPLGAKIGSLTDRAWNGMLFLSQLDYEEMEDNVHYSADAVNELGQVTTAWSNATRGYHALQTGKLYSNKGAYLVEDMSNAAAIATMFGAKSIDEMAGYNAIPLLQDRNKLIKETAKSVQYFKTKADMQDRSTKSGEAEFRRLKNISKLLLNNPYKSDIMRQVKKLKFFNKTPMSESTQEQLQDNRKQLNKFEMREE